MFETIKDMWKDILETVKDERDLTDVSFRTWLYPLRPVSLENGVLTIFFPGDKASVSFIEKRYAFFLNYVIEEKTGVRCTLRFVTSLSEHKEEKHPAYSSDASVSAANLNSRYTFDSFVVGNNNKMAHAAALSAAEDPGKMYNPLYIYGGVGLGKTHLMQSIAHFILKADPQTRVLYVTCEKFMNELIDAIRNKDNISTTEFREKYRNVDVLLIDDIQFISKKTGTQEELFHTFNVLYEAHKQIVISSDRPPQEIDNLEDRLRSRFQWGLTERIGLPDYETRMAILRKKEELEGYNIDNEVIKYIAANIKSNIRELEGALTKIVALSRVTNKVITLEMAEDALRDTITPDAPREITLPFILDVVAEHFSVSSEDIISKKKDSRIVLPRQVVMYLGRSMTENSLITIGQFLGGRDHATVIHGIKKISEQLETDINLQNSIEVLKKKICI